MKEENLFDLLGVAAKEDVHTNLFKYCIENSPHFREIFFLSILKWPSDTELKSIDVRPSIIGTGLPDLVIVGQDSADDRLAIVELKLHANEGINQTERYASSECLGRVRAEFGMGSNTINELVFLTLYPTHIAECEDFRSISLQHLVAALRDKDFSSNALASQLVQHWVACVGEFYSAGDLKSADVAITKLASTTALDSGFLRFSTLFGSLSPAGLKSTGPWRGNPRGRPYYGIRYQKESWHPEELQSGGWTRFDPLKHFDIHIECQYQRQKKELDVFIHYETNPYQRRLNEVLSKSKLLAHMDRRKKFKAALAESSGDRFVPAADGFVNQIGRINFSTQGIIVKEFRRRFERMLSDTASAVDQALRRVS